MSVYPGDIVVDPHKRENDIDKLDNSFKIVVKDLLEKLEAAKIPLELFETTRTTVRQQMLYDKGYSKTLNSKHIGGFAVDLVYHDEKKGWSWDLKRPEVKKAYKEMVHLILALDNNNIRLGYSWGDWPHIEQRRTT